MKCYTKITTAFVLVCLSSFFALQAQVMVKGTVSNKLNASETLIGVNVQEVDPSNRVVGMTITDYNGQYVLKVKSTGNKLVFSYIGFEKKTETIGTRTQIDVALSEESLTLEAAVVTGKAMHDDGSGFQIPKREIGAAMQTISTKDFEGLQVGTLDEALQGRVAGLDIVSVSGNPGSGSSMRIRGTSSITGNHEPLIVMNGVPYEAEGSSSFDFANSNEEDYADLLSINPDDIEEITVLKDAASTAIWGARGANGVLMVTTKRGRTGPTRISYTYRATRAEQPVGLNMLSGDDYTMMIKQAYFNPRQDENASDIPAYNYDPSFVEYENFNNNTDWVKAVSQIGWTNDHYVTVSGGGDRAKFRVSGGFYDQTGTVIEQRLQRYSTRTSLDYTISDRLKILTEFSFTYSDNQRNYKDSQGNHKEELLSIAYRKMPNVSIFAQDLYGNDTDTYYNIPRSLNLANDQKNLRNPVALAKKGVNDVRNFRALPSFRLQYELAGADSKISTRLQYIGYVSFDINNNKTTKFLPWDAINELFPSRVNAASGDEYESMAVYASNSLNWQPKFRNMDHVLTLYGEMQLRTNNSSGQYVSSYGLSSTTAQDASQEASLDNLSSSRSRGRNIAFLARANYSYQSKYIAYLTLRKEGSTRFAKGNKFHDYPGISLRWNISDEPFMENFSSWLNMLSLRPSWGISGKEPGGEYLYQSRYGQYGAYVGNVATRPVNLQLSDLRPEMTSSWNVGSDVELFGHRLNFDVNVYHKRTVDMLFERLSLPSTSGYPNLSYANAGTMDNDGWEFNAYTNRLISKGDFSIDFNFNISNYVNTIIELDDKILANYNVEYSYANGAYMTRLQEGNSFGSIYGFRYKGVYAYDEYDEALGHTDAPVARDKDNQVIVDEKGEALPMVFAAGKTFEYEFRGGDAKYEDINHDGSIDELDIVYLGNCNPLFNGGFGLTFRYKDFSCNAFFNYRYGNMVVNGARMNAENMYTDENQSVAVNWRWRKDGDQTEIPRALYNYGYNWLGSDRFVEDASFLRFKYLTFNYRVPKEVIKPLGMESMTAYLTINNVCVFTNYTGVDPEIGYGQLGISRDDAQTPRSKDVTLGISVAF